MITASTNRRPHQRSGRAWFYGAAFGLLAGLAFSASAQLPTATILGVVRDTSGAVVAGVTLTARNVETGQLRTTVSATDGSYRFPALQVGPYEVRAEQAGFETVVRSGLNLAVSEEAVVNFSLQVGTVAQTVAVTAEAPSVDTTSGAMGGLVNEQSMTDLPLNGRNYINLTLLQMGVHQQSNVAASGTNGGTWYSSNGAPLRSNNYLLDGAPLVTILGATTASTTGETLGVDGIREYRVLTNSFSAEYGMMMGSQTVIVSKGGTNAFHGSAFEFLRNSALDARNFFDYPSIATKPGFRLPEFQRNQFGGSGGGPIKKDKTFFFAVYEGLRARVGTTTIDTVLPASCHVTTNNPCTSPAGGTVAANMQPFLALFPVPNLPANQYTFPFTQPIRDDYGQIRVDQNFSTNDKMFARYTIQDSEQVLPPAYPQFYNPATSRLQYATLAEDHIFSPILLNSFRFSYSRSIVYSDSYAVPSISGPQYSFIPGQDMGGLSIGGGITGFGPTSATPSDKKQNVFTWSDDLFLTRGKNSLKMGMLINHYQQWLLLGTSVRGSVSFATPASFLQAQATTYSAETPGSLVDRTWHTGTMGFYFQDDLRLTSNFTLNLGLRYEFATQIQEAFGHSAALRDVRLDSHTTLGPPYKDPTYKNFGPRLGFAWDVNGDGKTAVRGGFGVLYDLPVNFGNMLNATGTGTPPFSSLTTVTKPATLSIPFVLPMTGATTALRLFNYDLEPTQLLGYNLTVERQLPLGITATLAYAGSRGLHLIQNREGNPALPQILSNGQQFWTGTESRQNPNWGTIDFYASQGDSSYNSMQFGLTKRLTRGIQFQSAYTWSKLIDDTQGQATTDTTADQIYGSDPTRNGMDRGLADFNIAQVWTFNIIYNLPQPLSASGFVKGAMNGWWVSGILSLQSGLPLTETLNTNRSLSQVGGGGGGIDRPDLVPGVNTNNITSGVSTGCGIVGTAAYVAPGTPLGTPARWFDPCVFSIPVLGFLGNAGRNIITGPGLANLDFSLVKDTAIKHLGESGKLEFRLEIFNILNRANFAEPNRTVYTAAASVEDPLSTAGQITSTAGKSRQIQLALKLLF